MIKYNSWEKGLFSIINVPGGPSNTETTYWWGRDSNPKKNPNSEYNDTDITYSWNSYGFRSDEFVDDGRDSIMVVGCSHTVGVGCPLEHTWPHFLKNKINPNLKVYNLSSSSSSSDFVARTIYRTLEILKPKAVFVLWPAYTSREIPIRGRYMPYKIIAVDNEERQSVTKQTLHKFSDILTDFSYFMYQQKRNELFTKLICKDQSIPFYELSSSIVEDLAKPDLRKIVSNVENPNGPNASLRRIGYQFESSVARDNFHFGKERNEYVADLFYEKYKSSSNNT